MIINRINTYTYSIVRGMRSCVIPGGIDIPLLIFLSISLMSSCDNRFEFLEDVNTPPALSIRKEGTESTDPLLLIDGVKTSLKHNNLPYVIEVSAMDRETNILKVGYRFISGNGSLLQGEEKLNGSINLFAGAASVLFEPQDPGKVIIEFFVEDDFRRRVVAKAELNVFLNQPPIAKFKYRFLGKGAYEYELDASESIDQDHAQGGHIQIYRFIINGNYEIKTRQPIVIHSFPGPGPDMREVNLEVIDSDGERSPMFADVVVEN